LDNLEWVTNRENQLHYLKLNFKKTAIIKDSSGNIIEKIDLNGKTLTILTERL
jgi:hypothetical protein